MRLTTLAMLLAGLGCSDDGGGASSTPCEAHADCDLAGQEICDLDQGVCATHGLCAPRSEEAFASLHCPYPDLVCEGGACVPPVSTGGEGEGEAGAEVAGEGEAGAEQGAGDVGGEAAGAAAGGGEGAGGDEGAAAQGGATGDVGEGEGEAGGGGDLGGGEGAQRPPPEPGDGCERHTDCQGGRIPDLTCKALGDEGLKFCTMECSFDADCPDLVDEDGQPAAQCCTQAVGGRFCGDAALCLDPTECFDSDDCPAGRQCFDRPDLGADARRCHGGSGLGGACPGGFLDCNPDVVDRCIWDRQLRRAYCTVGCAPALDPDPDPDAPEGQEPGLPDCPGWTCCGDTGFDQDPAEMACLNGGEERCDLFGRDCHARDDRRDLLGDPDDSCAAARDLPEEGFEGVLCPNDEDWSYVEVELGRSIFGDLSWTQPLAADPPTFELRDEGCNIVAEGSDPDCRPDAGGETETCNSSVSTLSPDPGRYHVVVEAETAHDVTYALAVRRGCLNDGECRRDPDRDRQSCLAIGGQPGACQDGFPCVTNDDCSGSRVCNQADLSCVEICVPDRYDGAGGNENCGGPQVPDLSVEGAGGELTLCNGDEDWFVVGVAQGEGLEVELDYARAAGPLSASIWSTDCRTLLRTSNVEADRTRARLEAAPVGGNYYVRVAAQEVGAQNEYQLVHSLRPGGFCIDDDAEEDDYRNDAVEVVGLEVGGDPVEFDERKGCDGDDDWFSVEMLGQEMLSVFVDSPVGEAEGDLNVDIYGPDPGGDPLASGRNAEAGEEVHLQVPVDGVYHVKLSGGLDLAYTARFERAAAPCEDDIWEPNNAPGEAEVLAANSDAPLVREARYCGGSDDWWRIFWLRRGGMRVEVCVDDPLEGDLDLAVYRAGHEEEEAVGFSINVQTPCEVVDIVRLPEEGDYSVRVWSRERPQVPYTMSVTLVDPCADERYEPNDENGASRELQPGAHAGLRRCDGDEDWFHTAKPRDATLAIDVLTAPDAPELNVWLYNRNGASALSQFGPERPGQYAVFSDDAFFGGNEPRYKLRVHSDALDDIVDYQMRVVVAPPPGAECLDDDLREPLDSSFVRAAFVDPGRHDAQVLCAGDLDHWPVVVDVGRTLTADLEFTHADGDLTLVLMSPDGLTELARSAGEGDTERVVTPEPAAEAGRYVVRVEGAAAEVANAYVITLGVE